MLYNYQNGNCDVTIYKDGTKVRKWEGEAKPIFPESIDIKITNYCDAGCKFCFESSTPKGLHGDISIVDDITNDLPAGTELALGGGNPLSHPELDNLLLRLRDKGIICNITVNSLHLSRFKDKIEYYRKENLIYGLGISYNRKFLKEITDTVDQNTVIHVIAGLYPIQEIITFLQPDWKLLVLGYKQHGFGEKYFRVNPVNNYLNQWHYWINSLIRKFHVSFDNLGIKQMQIDKRLESQDFNKIFMGKDGQFTMYIDCVTRTFTKSSTTTERYEVASNIKDMFDQVRKMS